MYDRLSHKRLTRDNASQDMLEYESFKYFLQGVIIVLLFQKLTGNM